MVRRKEFDEEPVEYCKDCLSLRILSLDEEMCYCDDCGSTNVGSANILEWQDLVKRRACKKTIQT